MSSLPILVVLVSCRLVGREKTPSQKKRSRKSQGTQRNAHGPGCFLQRREHTERRLNWRGEAKNRESGAALCVPRSGLRGEVCERVLPECLHPRRPKCERLLGTVVSPRGVPRTIAPYSRSRCLSLCLHRRPGPTLQHATHLRQHSAISHGDGTDPTDRPARGGFIMRDRNSSTLNAIGEHIAEGRLGRMFGLNARCHLNHTVLSEKRIARR